MRYQGRLDKKDFLSFDSVFVTTNVTLDCYARTKVEQMPERYSAYFNECANLRLYLVSEFDQQKRMMTRSPMSLYLDQWAEVTNRLIDYLSYGGHIQLSVEEWLPHSIQGVTKYTILYVKSEKKLQKFADKEEKQGHWKFFILCSDAVTKRYCEIRSNEEGRFWLRVQGEIDDKFLLDCGFQIDLYSTAIPYAEKQQANAFSMFREGRVAEEEVKAAIINVKEYRYSDSENRIADFFNQKIRTNKAQMEAVTRAFSERRFFLIQGPPGTGKTTVIKELILQQLQLNPQARIIVVSQANVAVDNVLRGIVAENRYIQASQIVRCGNKERIADDLTQYSFEEKLECYKERLSSEEEMPTDPKVLALREKWLRIIRQKGNEDMVGECFLGGFQIIGATCVGLENRHYGLTGVEFDLAVIDEAGKAWAGELLIPINHAKKVVIIGDHKQLPPVVNPALYQSNGNKGNAVSYSDVVEEDQQVDFLNRSFFKRLYDECPENSKCMLNIQFRMPPVIANLVNMFYDGQLETGKNCFQKCPMFLGNHLIFVDMKDEPDYYEQQKQYDGGGKGSPYNEKELEAACTVIRKIRGYYNDRIVVITPYKGQKKRLHKRFSENGLQNVQVNTIDAFQGDEEDIVIYCTTRAKSPTSYFSDSARLNVAFSRAKNTLIFLASSDYLKKYPKNHILRRVSEYLDSHAAIVPYAQWLEPNFQMRYDSSYRDGKASDTEIIKPRPQMSLLSHLLTMGRRKTPPSNEENDALFPIPTAFFDRLAAEEAASESSVCKSCGKALEPNERDLCAACLMKTESYKCKCCSEPVFLSYYDKYVHGDSAPELCGNCEETVCSECGAKFYIRSKQLQDLKTTGKAPLCQSCKEKFRQPVSVGLCKKCNKNIVISYGLKRQKETEGKPMPTLCDDCRKKAQELTRVGECVHCSKPIMLKNSQKWWMEENGKPMPTLCDDCRKKAQELTRVGECVYCSKPIMLKNSQKWWYKERGLNLPKRCPECLKKANRYS